MQLKQTKTNFWHKKEFVLNFTHNSGLILNGNIFDQENAVDPLDFNNLINFDPFDDKNGNQSFFGVQLNVRQDIIYVYQNIKHRYEQWTAIFDAYTKVLRDAS